MKASELMAHLIKVIADHGNIDVEVFDRIYGNYHQPIDVVVAHNESGTTAIIEL